MLIVNPRDGNPPARFHPARRLALAGALVALGAGLTACRKPATGEAPAPTNATVPPAAASPAVPENVRRLLGRWARADGGYVLELKRADLSGALEAAYFNPKPIHVSRSIWMQGGPGLQVVVELNDVGYPGATYVLTYDPQGDRLAGQYTQPAMQQSFDIEFAREPKP